MESVETLEAESIESTASLDVSSFLSEGIVWLLLQAMKESRTATKIHWILK
jgi:hypothetical protein